MATKERRYGIRSRRGKIITSFCMLVMESILIYALIALSGLGGPGLWLMIVICLGGGVAILIKSTSGVIAISSESLGLETKIIPHRYDVCWNHVKMIRILRAGCFAGGETAIVRLIIVCGVDRMRLWPLSLIEYDATLTTLVDGDIPDMGLLLEDLKRMITPDTAWDERTPSLRGRSI
ncbi:MAG: hypothetical protein ACYC0V_08640 [Armatimonadota bacterium]